MSFRVTNELIGTFKQRLLWTRAQREIMQRTYIGTCGGITATCDAWGKLLSLTADEQAQTAFHEGNDPALPIDAARLTLATKAAVWQAVAKIKGAKEEAFRNSIQGARLETAAAALTGDLSTQAALATTKHIATFATHMQDASALPPFAFRSEVDNTATMKAVREAAAARDRSGAVPLLQDLYPEFTAAVRVFESDKTSIAAGANSTNAAQQQQQQQAGVAAGADREYQNLFMRFGAATERSKEELRFWTRVEAVRKAQSGALGPNVSANKRPYKDQAGATLQSNFEEKISPRFIPT